MKVNRIEKLGSDGVLFLTCKIQQYNMNPGVYIILTGLFYYSVLIIPISAHRISQSQKQR